MKILSRRKLLVVILLGCAFSLCSLWFIFHFISENQKENGSALPTANSQFNKQEKPDFPLPVRLKIPSINVDSTLEYVGLTSEGRVDVPTGPESAAWFYLGTRPGEIGSAIIDGHAGYKNNRPAVFDDLYKLNTGDKIFIEDDKGGTLTFIVRESRRYNPKAIAPDVFGSNDDKAHLNLITCTGLWDKTEKTHSDRLVVFTDKVEQ